MKKISVLPVLLATLLGCTPADSRFQFMNPLPVTMEGKVVAVKDGDTFIILENKQQVTVRLSDIDCPEKKQPFGTRAKQFASDLCFGKLVTVRGAGKHDRYGRLLGEVFVGDTSINKELVRNGLAWHFTRYSSDQTYADLELSAREKKLGLWSEPDAKPPWKWRDHQSELQLRGKTTK